MENKVKFYSDEQIDPQIIKELRRLGIEALSCQEANNLGKSDIEQLNFATQNNFTIITQDADFIDLHYQGFKHQGIVYATKRKANGLIIKNLQLIFELMTPEEMTNYLHFVAEI